GGKKEKSKGDKKKGKKRGAVAEKGPADRWMPRDRVAHHTPNRQERIKDDERDEQASRIAAREQRRVTADVTAPIREGHSGTGRRRACAGGLHMHRWIMPMNPATDSDEDRQYAKHSYPRTRQHTTAEKPNQADGDERSEAQILPKHNVRASKPTTPLREKQSEDKDVVDVGSRERYNRSRDSSENERHLTSGLLYA